mmetsp:Transcript_14407/g.47774  ORF Transcript_14407/g.47774 Transcript_14407/m.47774 type:complete len:301 (-) Transcript_14407:99-1001(-)
MFVYFHHAAQHVPLTSLQPEKPRRRLRGVLPARGAYQAPLFCAFVLRKSHAAPRAHAVRHVLVEETFNLHLQLGLQRSRVQFRRFRPRALRPCPEPRRVPREPVKRREHHPRAYAPGVHLVLYPVPARVGVDYGVVQVKKRDAGGLVEIINAGFAGFRGLRGVHGHLRGCVKRTIRRGSRWGYVRHGRHRFGRPLRHRHRLGRLFGNALPLVGTIDGRVPSWDRRVERGAVNRSQRGRVTRNDKRFRELVPIRRGRGRLHGTQRVFTVARVAGRHRMSTDGTFKRNTKARRGRRRSEVSG